MKYAYLLEVWQAFKVDRFEPIGVYSTETHARKALRSMIGFKRKDAIITRLIVNCDYAGGIGAANHWHISYKD